MSKQKEVVYTVVNSSFDHPTAELVLFRAKSLMPSINLATVYRNLDVLSKEGRIRRVKHVLGDRFDKTLHHHAHFICENCGEFTDICEIDLKKVIDNLNFSIHNITSVDFVITGTCSNCKNKGTN